MTGWIARPRRRPKIRGKDGNAERKNNIPSESERVPLEVRDFRATQEDVLSSTCGGLLLLDLDFHDLGRVLNDLRDISPVTRADFTKDTLVDPDNSTNEPVTLLTRSKCI